MMTLARETVWLAVVCMVDMILTAYLITTGIFTEGNPLLAHFLQYGLGMMCLVKLASFALPLGVAEWYRQQYPVFVQWALRATLCLYLAGYLVGVTAINLPALMF